MKPTLHTGKSYPCDENALPPSSAFLGFFHGRSSPDEVMLDWGTNGPILGPIEMLSVNLSENTIRVNGENGSQMVIPVADEMAALDGRHYGDFTFFTRTPILNSEKTLATSLPAPMSPLDQQPGPVANGIYIQLYKGEALHQVIGPLSGIHTTYWKHIRIGVNDHWEDIGFNEDSLIAKEQITRLEYVMINS